MEAFNQTSVITLRCTETTILECPLCMEQFVSPRILPCQHTFCKECLTQLITKNCLESSGRVNKRSFPCPICRRDCKLFKRVGVVSMDDHLKGFPEHRLVVNLINENDEKNIIDNNVAKNVEAESQSEGHLNEAKTDNEDTQYLIHKTLCHYYLLLYNIYHYLGYCNYLQNRNIWSRPALRDVFLNPRLNATFVLNLRYAIYWLRCGSLPIILSKETIPLDVFPKPNEFDTFIIKNKWQHVEQLQYTIEELIDSSRLDDAINSKWHDQLRSKLDDHQWYENTRYVATQTDIPKHIFGIIWTFIRRFCLLVLSHMLFTEMFSAFSIIVIMISWKWPMYYNVNVTWKEYIIVFELRLCVFCFIIYWYNLIQNLWVLSLLCAVSYIVVWLIISPFVKEWKILFFENVASATRTFQNNFQTYKRIVHMMCFVENVLRFYVITQFSSNWYEPFKNMLLVDYMSLFPPMYCFSLFYDFSISLFLEYRNVVN